jgi:PAS domain S-box-containing protein
MSKELVAEASMDSIAEWRPLNKDQNHENMLFDRMLNGFAYHKIILDDSGKPVDYVFLDINDTFEKMTGLRKEKVIGKRVTDVIKGIETDPADWIGVYGRVALTEEPVQFENYAKQLDKWFRVSAYCPRKGYFVALFEEITEQKRVEGELRKARRDWELTFDNMPDYVAVLDKDFRIVRANKPFANYFGADPESIKGLFCYKCVHGTTFPPDFCPNVLALKDGKEHTAEVFEPRLGGYFIVSVTPLIDEDGKVSGSIHVARNITERKKVEEKALLALANSKQRQHEISALLKASQAVLQNKDFEGAARAIFNSCKELLGATAGYVALLNDDGTENDVLFLDAGGSSCTVDPSLPMPIRGLRAKAYDSGQVVVENCFQRSQWKRFMPEGHVELRNVLFAPLIIQQKTVGVIGLANKAEVFTERDCEMAKSFGELASISLVNSRMIDMLEENRKELEAHSTMLMALVEERTKELRDSERLAAIGATAGMVGHDIRNPLQAIAGELFLANDELKILPEGECKQQLKESLDCINEQIMYVNKIVTDLQDFARPLMPKIEEVHLRKIIDTVLSSLNLPSTDRSNVRVDCRVDEDFRLMKVDPSFIQRILQNLITNSIQAMPDGGDLLIDAVREKDKVRIIVQDTGNGIPASIQDKLFSPLFTTKSKGQGFGLAVVKRLTESLGGIVKFESVLGQGTKFMIDLPP